MRTLRDWGRWLSTETGSPWMAALVLGVFCGSVVVTAWAARHAMTGIQRVERAGGHIQQKP